MVRSARRARLVSPPGGDGPRTRADRLLLYGHHAVSAALGNPARPAFRLLVTDNARRRLPDPLPRPDLAVERVQPVELDRLLPADAVHQGVVLEAGPLPEHPLDELVAALPETALLVLLDQIEDPRNLGAILRSAAALGVAAVLLPRHGSGLLGGACAKAASGGLDLVPVIEVVNLAAAIEELKQARFWAVGLEAEAAQPVETLPPDRRWALVVGAEGRGLRPLTRSRCDWLARLAIDPRMDSLNVSVATGIALYLLRGRAMSAGLAGGGAHP